VSIKNAASREKSAMNEAIAYNGTLNIRLVSPRREMKRIKRT
jgi:hypothetical protein